MKSIPVFIGTHLRVHERDLPPGVAQEAKEALQIPNEAKVQARREKLPEWIQMPDYIELWRYDGHGRLVLPRGFLSSFIKGLSNEYKFEWEDERTLVPMDEEFLSYLNPITLRPHQEPAVRAMLHAENGIYEAPPGSGKTITVLEAIRRSQQRAIILVDKSNLAEQWRLRAKEFLGVETGMIGDGVFDPGEITVALKQTLWARRHQLKREGFFDEWGFVAYDECHHITAETYQFVVQQFPSRFLFGVSATPARVPWTFPIATGLLGPIIHRTRRDFLQGQGILMRPKIKVVATDFSYQFTPTKINKGGYRVGNNYPRMMKALVEDTSRNRSIAELIAAHPERHILVVSQRLEHFKRIRDQLGWMQYQGKCLEMTGKESRQERMKIQQIANEEPCVVFSTVADEGVDIPRLDMVVLIWPTKNISKIRQQIGRVERGHSDKPDPLVFDFYDARVPVLKRQFSDRCAGVYKAEELDLEYV